MCDFHKVNYYNGNPSPMFNLPISLTEISLIVWVLTYGCEELRKFTRNDIDMFWPKLKSYLFQNWNLLVLISIALFFVGEALRFVPNDSCFLAARSQTKQPFIYYILLFFIKYFFYICRIVLAIDVMLWFLRCLTAYWFIKTTGPILVLIERMVWQLFYYSVILLMLIFAFGVSTQSLMFPNQKLDKTLLKNLFFPGFFVLGKEYYTRETIMSC
jgi:transient receptor potential cation channel subfamily M protein 2